MKTFLITLGFLCCYEAYCQHSGFRFYNPALDPAQVIEGQGWPREVKNFYDRLPESAGKSVSGSLWNISTYSAGLQLHFTCDAEEVTIKYTVTGPLQTSQWPASAVSGIDLYVKNSKGSWDAVAGSFAFGDTVVYNFRHLSPVKKEYILYFPTGNTISWMQMDVPANCTFTPLPARQKLPVVVYGTAIVQGAGASRPGLIWTNILSRKLDVPFINLGFSGNGKLEPEIIDLISQLDAKAYVLDCLPNLTSVYIPANELKSRIVNAVTALRSKRPLTPVVLTEHAGYSDGTLTPVPHNEKSAANKALGEVFDSLRASGVKNIYLLKNAAAHKNAATTTDGSRSNDLKMISYANAYDEKLPGIIKNSPPAELPSLIPFPQQIKWTEGFFELKQCKAIVVRNARFKREALYLQNELQRKGIRMPVVEHPGTYHPVIEIGTDVNDTASSTEAYRLKVIPRKINLTSKTEHGIFNGIQTLLQLSQAGTKLFACDIADWPSFSWRGYMVDVGRNYMSMDLLKQQIDIMARYKLNIFHFHPTEDIAWRFEIKRYPRLTAAEYMLRNKGKFYSQKDIKELIAYCKERHITFIPEIDMPGHSAAFRRAMGTDMQSDSGLQIVKNILTEICTEFDMPYIHIGADEVKITNRDFIPEVTALLQKYAKKVIGWQPGGNFTEGTIRQMWMDDNGKISSAGNIQWIDSRHLYLNHMDPLESVVIIFNRKIGNKPKGDSLLLGGTICLWNDRAAASESDLLRMNPVIPSMLAFAERTWRGGGQAGWIANINDGDKNDFFRFEEYLLKHRKIYYSKMPFPYVKQQNHEWLLYGPYTNAGEGNAGILQKLTSGDIQPNFYKKEYGGTIVLRHWWYPLIKGAVDSSRENTTFFAVTRLWSSKDTTRHFWIGFNNLSRSTATDPPPPGAWDDKGSEIWVNDIKIPPPVWRHAGLKGDLEMPLIDEGYEYRQPSSVFLHKGWNTVVLKLPVGTFKAKNWYNPVKWMFTFAAAD